ncbi:hypothetical protein Mal33_46120 [Rosistilla oblonga]|uniref:Uncharacterized protein n=1 Tax=Rosistilla oblonga TaxID=2527990 RepID=A0A518IZS1_9BACT|nr:hypothetical protein Mal33_46120 [Rosistilla oblonga]
MRWSVRRGTPFGEETWGESHAQRLDLESTLRPRGRPRNLPSNPNKIEKEYLPLCRKGATVNHRSKRTIVTLPKRWGSSLLLVAIALSLFGFPFLIYGDPQGPDATVFMLSLTYVPGFFLLVAVVALFRLRVELEGRRNSRSIRLQLPKHGKLPWTPWMVHEREIPAMEISRVDEVLEAHPTEPDRISRRYILRTKQGDYYFTSLWFSNIEKFRQWCKQSKIPIGEVSTAQLADTERGDAKVPPAGAWAVRSIGKLLKAIAFLTLLASIISLFFVDAEGRWIAVQAFVSAGALLSIAVHLTKIRQRR